MILLSHVSRVHCEVLAKFINSTNAFIVKLCWVLRAESLCGAGAFPQDLLYLFWSSVLVTYSSSSVCLCDFWWLNDLDWIQAVAIEWPGWRRPGSLIIPLWTRQPASTVHIFRFALSWSHRPHTWRSRASSPHTQGSTQPAEPANFTVWKWGPHLSVFAMISASSRCYCDYKDTKLPLSLNHYFSLYREDSLRF